MFCSFYGAYGGWLWLVKVEVFYLICPAYLICKPYLWHLWMWTTHCTVKKGNNHVGMPITYNIHSCEQFHCTVMKAIPSPCFTVVFIKYLSGKFAITLAVNISYCCSSIYIEQLYHMITPLWHTFLLQVLVFCNVCFVAVSFPDFILTPDKGCSSVFLRRILHILKCSIISLAL